MMLGVFIGADGPDFPIVAGIDIGAFGILAAWTVTGGALLALAAVHPGREPRRLP